MRLLADIDLPVPATVTGDAPPGRATATIAGGKLPTPLKIGPLTSLLADFPKKDYLINGFTHGFSLEFKGTRVGFTSHNSPTVINNLGVALEKVGTEVKLGRISGPFLKIPYPNLKCTPFSL